MAPPIFAKIRRTWHRMPHVATKWRYPRVIFGLFMIELLGVVASLALFGIAQSDTWRTALWRDGNFNGYNSSPSRILYAYANHEPLPHAPLIWSDYLIQYNVIVSVISMFTLILKPILHILHIYWPILALGFNSILVALWSVATYAQQSSDYTDPQYPAPHPWYLVYSCNVAYEQKNVKNCQMAKGSFAVAVIMLTLYLVGALVALHSMIWPRSRRGHSRNTSDDSENELKEGWKMDNLPKTPKPKFPMTPKTFAFNKLEGKA